MSGKAQLGFDVTMDSAGMAKAIVELTGMTERGAAKITAVIARLSSAYEAQAKAQQAAARAGAQAFDDQATASKRFMDSLREQVATQGKSATEMLRYRAAQLGLSQAAEDYITRLEQQSAKQKAAALAAQEEAEAQRAAALAKTQAAAATSNFLRSVQERAETQGMSQADLLRRQATKLGVGDQAAAHIAAIEQYELALGRGTAAQNASAMATREDRVQKNLLSQAYRLLPMQITDMVTSLASGMPVWMIAIQQGGQIKDSLTGIQNPIRALLGFLNPLKIALGVGGVAAGAFAYEVWQGREAAEALRKSLALTNNASGLTATSFRAAAAAAAEATGSTVGAGREAVQALASTGRISRDNMDAAARAALLYAKATGGTADEVSKDMASMMDGVLKWAEAHNKSMHFMSAADMDRVRALESQGKSHDAAGLVLDRYNEHLQGTRKELSLVESVYKSMTQHWSEWTAKIQDFGKPAGIEDAVAQQTERLRMMREELEQYRKSGNKGVGVVAYFPQWVYTSPKGMEDAIAQQQALVDKLKETAATREHVAKAASDVAKDQERAEIEASKGMGDAKAALALAQNSLMLQITKAGLDQRARVIEQAYASGQMSESQYREEVFTTERARLRTELETAKAAAAIEAGRKTESPTDVVQRDTAAANAKAKVAQAQAELNKLEDEYTKGASGTYLSLANEMRKYAAETDIMEGKARKLGQGEQWAAEQVKRITESVKGLTDAQRTSLGDWAAKEGSRRDSEASRQAVRDWIKQQEDAVAAIDAETDALGRGTLAKTIAAQQTKMQAGAQAEANKYPERAEEIWGAYADELERVTAAEKRKWDASRSAGVGAQTVLNKYVEDATNAASVTENFISGSLQRTEDAFIKMVKTGKLELGDLFGFMAEEYMLALYRMQVAQFIQGTGATSSGGFLSIFYSLFGGGTPSTYTPSTAGTGDFARMDRSGVSGFANGLTYVPYDNFPAMLHQGERVLTKMEATRAADVTGPSVTTHIGAITLGAPMSRAEVAAGIADAIRASEARTLRRLSQRAGVVA